MENPVNEMFEAIIHKKILHGFLLRMCASIESVDKKSKSNNENT